MKTNLDTDYKTNETLEKEGVWMAVNSDVEFLVRRFNQTNPRVKAAMTAYYKPYARLIDLGMMPPEKTLEIQLNLFVDICLADWKGLKDDKGKDIPFSKETAREVLKGLPDVFLSLWAQANSADPYKEVVGNSLSVISDGPNAGKKS